ncbi:hypothetical protein [Desulfotruncus arcticus]|nr:hypothetical protein [Desulfotruncus arcticus]
MSIALYKFYGQAISCLDQRHPAQEAQDGLLPQQSPSLLST